jgi:hypothetical protein
VQFANTLVDGFLSDPTFTFNTTTKSVEAKLLDNIPYVSQFQTGGGGNGINNFFGTNPTANTNQIAIVDNGDAADTTHFAIPNGSILENLTSFGTFGTWFTNCNSFIGFDFFPNLPFIPGASRACDTIWANQNIANGQSTSAAAGLIVNTTTEFPGYDIGNPAGFTNGADTGWSGMLGVGINSVNWSQGINNTLTIGSYKNAAGDQNILEITGSGVGGCTAASDQCITPLGINVIQTNGIPFGTIATTSGFGDTNPTYTLSSGALNTFSQGSPGGAWVIDTSNPVATGTMVSSGGRYNTTGATDMFLLHNGSGMTPSLNMTLTSVNGSGVYTGTITGGAGNAWAGYPFNISGFTNAANNTAAAFTVIATASTATTLTFNLTTVPETHSGNALQLWPIICTGGGGTGMTGWGLFIPSGGSPGENPRVGSPGFGYTSVPSCQVTSAAGGSDLTTVSAFLTTTLQALNIAGATLTPTPNICILTTPMDRSAVDMVNQNSNITCTVQNGTMDTSTNGGVVWIASDATPEMCKIISAGSVDSGTHNQALTVSCHLPHIFGSMMFQGGSSGMICLDAQAAGDAATQPWPFCVPDYGANNSSQVIYGWLFGGTQINGSLPTLGAMRASFTAPNNGFHIWKGAQIISTTNQGTVPTLNINDVTFAPGDGFESPSNAAFGLTGITAALDQQSPVGPSGGPEVAILGHGPNWTTGYTALQVVNENRFGMYQGCDVNSAPATCTPPGTPGWALGPSMITLEGPYANGISLDAPLPQGVVIRVNDTGSANYAIFTDTS